MTKRYIASASLLAAVLSFMPQIHALHKDPELPKEWAHLVPGGQFKDFILPAPIIDGLETREDGLWGTLAVLPRDRENSIEDNEFSYWGGRPILVDGVYHMFVARWREDHPEGHGGWKTSDIVRAVSESPLGPFEVKEILGYGHFPEVHLKSDGKYWVYHLHGAYFSDNIDGPWDEIHRNEMGLTYHFGSLALREDGSELVIDRFSRMWLREKDSPNYRMVSEKNVWPKRNTAAMGFEDPMIWRTEVQYHMLINDWYGRVCYHLRSKDGITWVEDPGMAYSTGIDRYEDGTVVDWYKLERPKIGQDQYGRAHTLYLAVMDAVKNDDDPNDRHSSKNIALPLVIERRIALQNEDPINRKTKSLDLLIRAEPGFDPHTDVDIDSLRLGAPEVVDFGRGSIAKSSEKQGDDLLVKFSPYGNGLTEVNFTAKLLGRTTEGKLLYGYSRLPGVDYTPFSFED